MRQLIDAVNPFRAHSAAATKLQKLAVLKRNGAESSFKLLKLGF